MWAGVQEPAGRDAEWSSREAAVHPVHTAFAAGDTAFRLSGDRGCGPHQPHVQQGERQRVAV
jgi:hypothetical protein